MLDKKKINQLINYLIGIVLCLSIVFQMYHYNQFVSSFNKFASKGPRFTAYDGQELCERVRKIEKDPKDCRYAEPK